MLTIPVASAWVRFPEPYPRNNKSELVEAELSALVLSLREQMNRRTFSFYPSIPHQLNRNSFSKKSRGLITEGRRDKSLPRNARTECTTRGSQGFKPPTKSKISVACNQCRSQAHTALHPYALCLLPSAFFSWRQEEALG